MKVERFYAQQHGDARGQLVALEEKKEIPFDIKRVYYIYDTLAGVHRGFHAHKSLKQLLICIHGSCKVLLDNGQEKEIVILDKPYEGIFIQNYIWREMYDFSSDAVLLVLASEIYDESDYIRDYDRFLQFVSNGGHEK
ncbi:sugar 3,4-ketoisomerase [Acetatifactor aquisgranensis]|uniref:sugar 3,4-ketoisomerase n=1 Tax=Acetatifactor aquisgranensis TaxID=2941233 RepID=UPI00203EF567|nr:FdtA/QdtA family cupin domain-containing protein [Acetatifactor aquisgranensis]